MTIPKDILQEQTASSLRLANQVFLIDETKNQNVILSPLSIHIALSMVAAGASGPVKDQIVSFIGAKSEEQLHNFAFNATHVIFSDSSDSGGPKLSAANAIWLKDTLTFKSPFKQTVESYYKAVTKLLDFNKVDESVQEVNAWAEQMTNGLIKDIVSRDNFENDAVMVLANALYFKAPWDDAFYPESTIHDTFHLMDGTSVNVPFMCSYKDRAIATYDTFKVLNLPYRKGNDQRSFSMSIFLPNDRDGLPSLLQRICTQDSSFDSSFLDRHIPKSYVNVGKLRIPKFKIEFNLSVMEVLKQLGLNNLGSLTEVVEEEDEPVSVSNILHKAFVEVNEEGTEAAAVTAVVCEACCYTPVMKVDFVADHPFMFVIREDSTGLVLFAGRVLNPAT